jgi:hypothetical protein
VNSRTDIPTLRKDIWSRYKRLRGILFEMLRIQSFLPGSVYELKTRCGKLNCACARSDGARHRRWVLSHTPEDGRKRLRVVPEEHYENWRRWAGNYSQFRRRRAEIVKLTRRILADLDAIERAQRRRLEK